MNVLDFTKVLKAWNHALWDSLFGIIINRCFFDDENMVMQIDKPLVEGASS